MWKKRLTDPRSFHPRDEVPQLRAIIPENVFLRSRQRVSSRRLQSFDVVLGHVDEEGKIRRVSPEADWEQKRRPEYQLALGAKIKGKRGSTLALSELGESQLPGEQLFRVVHSLLVLEGSGEPHG